MRAGETGVSESAALAHVFVLLHGNKHRLAVAQRFNTTQEHHISSRNVVTFSIFTARPQEPFA